jgi:hypothetical protein
MEIKLLLASLIVGGVLNPSELLHPGGVEMLFKIGEFDNSPAEFALAPSEAREFARRFPNGVTYVIGENTPSQFPFIHPSKADIAWGGKPVQPFRILFKMDERPEGGYALLISLFDQHERIPSTMQIELNGERLPSQCIPLGSGRAFYGPCEGSPHLIIVPIRADQLRQGENELVITLYDGSWVAYDALALARLKPAEIPAIPRRELKASEIEPSPEKFEVKGAWVETKQGGFRCIGTSGATVKLTPLFEKPVELEFDLALLRGDVSIAFAIPWEDARGDYWRLNARRDEEVVRWEIQPTPIVKPDSKLRRAQSRSRWYHVWTRHEPNITFLKVVDDEGEIVNENLLHLPGPPTQLIFAVHGTKLTDFTVTNLRWKFDETKEQIPTRERVRREKEVSGVVTLHNGVLELRVAVKDRMNPFSLRNLRTGKVYADMPYSYALNPSVSDELPTLESYRIEVLEDGSKGLSLIGQLGSLRIEHRFIVASGERPYIEEQIRIVNMGDEPVDTSRLRFGFVKRLGELDKGWDDAASDRLTPIPYRREPETGEFCDYRLEELTWRKGWFFSRSRQPRIYTSAFGSEGWAWVSGTHALVIAKHNDEAMEWSLMEPIWRGNTIALRFGGVGLWKRGDPEPAATLDPGESFTFGTTRYIPCDGGWKGAFYAFRGWMEELGHKVLDGYNPPVHWNELYDNPLWWGPDTPERRQQLYRREQMEEEARKAAELGCEALYLDPGWDTVMGSTIWAENRLGRQEEFVKMLHERYGLQLALHTPLAAWNDVSTYPAEARRKDRDGNPLSLCSASPAYLRTKAERLIWLCQNGASFLMFDGSAPTGECYDETHGHSLPPTRHEHCKAYLKLIQMVKEKFPNVLIELHDPIVAGVNVRYAPTYFLHALPNSFDELWGYEYMWDPMEDLMSGRALSLYYVNLAYSIPIYLHIDLRKDNEHALIFWWYASTCRHLGIGGKHPDPDVWRAHKRAMREYKRLKRFYTQGVFYGLGETVHAHALPEERGCVLNIFNLADVPVEREVRFRLSEVGLKVEGEVEVIGAPSTIDGGTITLWVNLPAKGHQLVEIRM